MEDELHIPALAALRAGCPALQQDHINLASMFATCDLRSLALFAFQALQEHCRLLESQGQPLWPAAYVPRANGSSIPRRQQLVACGSGP